MPQSKVQSTQNQSGAAIASLSKAFLSNNSANNLLVYAAVWDLLAPAPTVSDTVNTANIVSVVGPVTSALNGGRGQIWAVGKCVSGPNTFRLDWGAPNPGFAGMYIHEYTDSDSHSNGFTFDQKASNTGTGANPASGNTPATTQANEIVFGFSFSNGPVPTAGAGFVIEESDTVLNGVATEDKFVTTTGVQNAVFTEVSSDWAALCATFYTALTTVTPVGGFINPVPLWRNPLIWLPPGYGGILTRGRSPT